MARKLVSLAQYEMQAAANKGGAKEMYNNSGWSVGNNAARSTGQRAAAGSSGKRTGGASAGTAQSAGGTAQSQLLELYSAQQAALRAALRAARRAAYESTVADQQRQYQQNLSRVNAAADQALREAYLNKMESLKGLNQALTAQGLSGGASETALAGLYNNYGSARSQIEAQRLEQQGNLQSTLQSNLAAAYNTMKTGEISDLKSFAGDLARFYASNAGKAVSTGQGGEGASAIWYALARRALGTGADSDEVQRQLSGAGADRQMVEQIMALLSNG